MGELSFKKLLIDVKFMNMMNTDVVRKNFTVMSITIKITVTCGSFDNYKDSNKCYNTSMQDNKDSSYTNSINFVSRCVDNISILSGNEDNYS